MPAPTKAQIKTAMEAAVAAKVSLNKAEGGGTSPALSDLIDAMAEGIANVWSTWQGSTVVVGQATAVQPGTGSAPVTGSLT